MADEATTTELPQAVLRPERGIGVIWVIPVLAAVLAGYLGYRSWTMRGVMITVQVDHGYGLVPGVDVRYRGISVGEVREVELSEGVDGITVRAALKPEASRLARGGTRFWVVRPQVGVTGVAGLETLVGPRYLAMLPGDGPPQRHFLGLSEPPIIESVQPGDLEVVLESPRRGGVRPGVPVLYRQVPVGMVLSVGLTSDGGAVEARIHIEKAYRELIRPETRFWKVGGLDARIGLRGVSLQVESLEALLAGGVSLATPPQTGPVVHNGHRFKLAGAAEDEWLTWEPLIVIGSPYLPPGGMMPSALRAVLDFDRGRWIKSHRSRRGWVLQTPAGLLGPADLLSGDADAHEESALLEVVGQPIPLDDTPRWTDGRLALIDARVSDRVWPDDLRRVATEPEDCLAMADSAIDPIPLSASRLTAADGGWVVDPIVSMDASWHGACVLSRADGRLVGLILVETERVFVALFTAETP